MATHITPTFLLKGVDPNKIINDYKSGVFNRKPTGKTPIVMSQNKGIIAPTYGSCNYDAVFSLKDKNNGNVVIATCGHSDFEVFTRTGGCLNKGGRCEYCREDFKHTAVGYPVGYQEMSVLNEETQKYRIVYIFWVEGRFCSFECALSFIKNMLARPAEKSDITLRDSEIFLRKLYGLMHPGLGPLIAAKDPRLLITNGGSLTKEEWEDKKHYYVKTDRVLMIPAKTSYIQNNF